MPGMASMSFSGQRSKNVTVRVALASITLLVLFSCRQAEEAATPELRELIERFSEPGGYFDTDNLVSNETSYGQVLDDLQPIGRAYIGVGPQQNFSYIARLRPRWAFIVDIRRENLLQHLLFNAILTQAETPYQYLCWLFSKPVDAEDEIPAGAPIDEMLSLFENVDPKEEILESNTTILLSHIENSLDIPLEPEERDTIRAFYSAFYNDQLDIRFHSHGRPPMPHHPTFRRLLLARDEDGAPANFLSSAQAYRTVRDLAMSGRLVPVVGDFAGSHALSAIGAFLKEQGETVSVFYTSNVEFYLMRAGRFDTYVDNIRSLPLTDESLFIRSYFDYGLAHPARLPGHRSTVVLQGMKRFLELYDSQAFRSYWDVCTIDYK
jgi:hypothetical protein